jgi:general stress protein 26
MASIDLTSTAIAHAVSHRARGIAASRGGHHALWEHTYAHRAPPNVPGMSSSDCDLGSESARLSPRDRREDPIVSEASTQQTRRSLKKLWKMVSGIEIAMMTTVDPDGSLRSRPMATQAIEADEFLWFFAAGDSGKVKAIRRNPNVALVYAEPAGNRYVVASGRARVTDNDAKARKLWSEAAQGWFPGGPGDGNLVLIEVDVDEADWWDGMESGRIDLD